MGSRSRPSTVVFEPAPLICIGRDRDRYGRPLEGPRGRPHALVLMPGDGETLAELEARARAAGWHLGPLPKRPGQARSVMCSLCGGREQTRLPTRPVDPLALDQELFAS